MTSLRMTLCLFALVSLFAACEQNVQPNDGNPSHASSGGSPSESTPRTPQPWDGKTGLEAIDAFIAARNPDTEAEGWRERLPQPPQVEFAEGQKLIWEIDIEGKRNAGTARIEFMPDSAPMHVSSFLYLTRLGYFDGLTFHRIVENFMAQGGCPKGTGMAGPGYTIEGEIDPELKHDGFGWLSAANTGQPKSDGSQFFLTLYPAHHLDGKHTIFGKVVGGKEFVWDLANYATRGGTPTHTPTIKAARVVVE